MSVQALSALERANEVRLARCELKRQLKAGECRIGDVLSDPPWFMERMVVEELLRAVPRVGRVKASRVLWALDVPPGKTVGELTDRQVVELIWRLQAGGRPTRDEG